MNLISNQWSLGHECIFQHMAICKFKYCINQMAQFMKINVFVVLLWKRVRCAVKEEGSLRCMWLCVEKRCNVRGQAKKALGVRD